MFRHKMHLARCAHSRSRMKQLPREVVAAFFFTTINSAGGNSYLLHHTLITGKYTGVSNNREPCPAAAGSTGSDVRRGVHSRTHNRNENRDRGHQSVIQCGTGTETPGAAIRFSRQYCRRRPAALAGLRSAGFAAVVR